MKGECQLDIETITTYEGLMGLETEWNRLLDRMRNENPCSTFEWVKSWWNGFGGGKSLYILVAREAGEIAGIAPLMVSTGIYRGLAVREIRLIENEHSPNADIIAGESAGAVIDAVIEHLRSLKGVWDIIRLNNIPGSSPTCAIMKNKLPEAGMLYGIRSGLTSPYVSVRGSWESFMAGRSKKFRKTLRNKLNRLNNSCCKTVLQKYEKADEWGAVLGAVYGISEMSWKAYSGRDVACSRESKVFVRELTKEMQKKGWFSLWMLRIGDEPVAYEYHIRYKNRIYALRSDYNEDYKDVSPGSVLEKAVMEDAFRNGYDQYNTCGTADRYKLKWTSDMNEHAKIIMFARSWYGKLLYFIDFIVVDNLKKYRLIQQIKAFLDNSHIGRIHRNTTV